MSRSCLGVEKAVKYEGDSDTNHSGRPSNISQEPRKKIIIRD